MLMASKSNATSISYKQPSQSWTLCILICGARSFVFSACSPSSTEQQVLYNDYTGSAKIVLSPGVIRLMTPDDGLMGSQTDHWLNQSLPASTYTVFTKTPTFKAYVQSYQKTLKKISGAKVVASYILPKSNNKTKLVYKSDMQLLWWY